MDARQAGIPLPPDFAASLREFLADSIGGALADAGALGGATAAEVRAIYLARVDGIVSDAVARIEAGEEVDAVVTDAVDARNALKIEMRDLGSWISKTYADIRNYYAYGDMAGPNAQMMFRAANSWQEVLQSVARTSASINKYLGQ